MSEKIEELVAAIERMALACADHDVTERDGARRELREVLANALHYHHTPEPHA